MRKVAGLTVAAVLLTAAPAQAEEWWFLRATEDFSILFIDAESLSTVGDARHFRTEFIYSTPYRKVKSMKADSRIDCEQLKFATISHENYDVNQKHLSSHTFKSPKEISIPPGSIMDAMRKFVCDSPSTWESELRAERISGSTHELAKTFQSALETKK